MKMDEYLKDKFPYDIGKMNFLPIPDDCLKCPSLKNCDKGMDANTVFFGGEGWKNIRQDIRNIDRENLEYFFICLFTIVTIDVGIYTYYKEYYQQFRKKTMYPKFGWYNRGFGISPNFVNPRKLLQIPESYGLINRENVSEYIDEYINLFLMKCNEFFVNDEIPIKTNEFIKKLLNDREFKIGVNNDSVFSLIYNKLNEIVNRKLL